MHELTIDLSDEDAAFISALVATGRFPSPEAFVLALLRNEREMEALRAKLDRGREGPFEEVDDAFLHALRSDDADAA